MRIRLALHAAFIATTLIAFAGCDGETPPLKDGKLDIESAPSSALKVGDTSSFFIVSKTVVLATGREDKTADYSHYHLVSSDTTVVGVFEDKRLVGRKAGTAAVSAKDDMSSLASETSVQFTVTEQ
jgi:hypothetical protein